MFIARRNSASDTESTSFLTLSLDVFSVSIITTNCIFDMPHISPSFIPGERRGQIPCLILCQQRHSVDIMHRIMVPLHKIHLSVLYNFWATVILYGFSCGSCIAFRTDEADGLVCCASPISDFLGDVSNIVIIEYRSTCLLHPPFLSRMEFCSTISRIRRLPTCGKPTHQETSVWIYTSCTIAC